MTVEEPITVAVWGFDERELAAWPDDLRPRPLPYDTTIWPRGEPLIVHLREAARFIEHALAHPCADGTLPTAILYVPAGQGIPDALDADFADVIADGRVETLRERVASWAELAAEALAEDLPASWLHRLRRPVAEIPVEELPLDGAARAQLQDTRQRRAFDQALEERLTLQRALFGPPQEWLDELVQEQAAITARYDSLAAAGAGPRVLPDVQPLFVLTAGLRSQGALLVAHGRDLLAALVRGRDGQRGQVVLTGARDQPAANREAAIDAALTRAAEPTSDGSVVPLPLVPSRIGVVTNFALAWDAASAEVIVSGIRQRLGRPLLAYRLLLRQGEQTLWEGASDADGTIRVPRATLVLALTTAQAAAADPPVEFVIAATPTTT